MDSMLSKLVMFADGYRCFADSQAKCPAGISRNYAIVIEKTDLAKAFRRWVLHVLAQDHNSNDYIVSSLQLSSNVTKFNGQALMTARRLAACFGLSPTAIRNYAREHASQLVEITYYSQLTGETQRLNRFDNCSSPRYTIT
ncbi:hypothetical protein VI06_20460 [Aquitalea magnusonii]|nr:hypothetical protein VI06_20460 [Aquitalea magnusonii]